MAPMKKSTTPSVLRANSSIVPAAAAVMPKMSV